MNPITQHNSMFMTVAGALCALAALGCLLAVAQSAGMRHTDIPTNLALLIAVITFTSFYRFGLLISAREMSFMLGRAARTWLHACVLIGLGYFIIPGLEQTLPRLLLLQSMLAGLPTLLLALTLLRIFALRLYGSHRHMRSAIVLAPGPQALLLAQRLARSPILGIDVAGYFGPAAQAPAMPLRQLGTLEDAAPVIAENRYRVVFIDSGFLASRESADVLRLLGDSTASLYIIPEPPPGYKLAGTNLAGLPMLALHETGLIGLARVVKRSMDIALSALAILLLSPLFAMIAIGIRVSSPGPVLFRQCRTGMNGQTIRIYKFRSMYVHDEDGVRQATLGDPRITPLGRLLRRTSLDELPQLFNVLRGSMSLVGPRPHAVEHNALYRRQIDGYMLRHTIKPGITGWAQINGLRGETDTLDKMRQRVEYDRFYIQNWSVQLDLAILWRSFWIIVRDSAAY